MNFHVVATVERIDWRRSDLSYKFRTNSIIILWKFNRESIEKWRTVDPGRYSIQLKLIDWQIWVKAFDSFVMFEALCSDLSIEKWEKWGKWGKWGKWHENVTENRNEHSERRRQSALSSLWPPPSENSIDYNPNQHFNIINMIGLRLLRHPYHSLFNQIMCAISIILCDLLY